MDIKRNFKIFLRVSLGFIGIVVFPLGLFMLGYIIGNSKREEFRFTKTKSESILTDSTVLSDEIESDRVVI